MFPSATKATAIFEEESKMAVSDKSFGSYPPSYVAAWSLETDSEVMTMSAQETCLFSLSLLKQQLLDTVGFCTEDCSGSESELALDAALFVQFAVFFQHILCIRTPV